MSAEAVARIERCHAYLLDRASGGDTLYGINTGFGDLATTRVNDLVGLQRNLLISHACGVGEPLPGEVVKAMLLLKVKALEPGPFGVAVTTVQRLLDHWNAGVLPVVPSQGSLGASGDLAPLAHLVLPLIGEGEVVMPDGRQMASADALRELGWPALELGPKEGLALINGTQMMLGTGMVALEGVTRLADWADALGAWSLEAWNGLMAAMHPSIHRIRNQAGAMIAAHNVASWLEGSERAAQPRTYVQDPYSFRCMPQVHGASRDVVEGVRAVFEAEMNAVTDNPLVFPDEDLIVSGGNFHGQPLALAMDRLALAIHEWASISERRVFKMLSGQRGLPAFLASNPGLNSGYMIPQYTAASLVSYSKQLCTPASADNADSSNGQEDHVSMGANGALQMWRVLEHAEQVLGIEAMCAAQASDLRGDDHAMAPALRSCKTRSDSTCRSSNATRSWRRSWRPLQRGSGEGAWRKSRPSRRAILNLTPCSFTNSNVAATSFFRWRSFIPLVLVPLHSCWPTTPGARRRCGVAGHVLGGGPSGCGDTRQNHRPCASRHERTQHRRGASGGDAEHAWHVQLGAPSIVPRKLLHVDGAGAGDGTSGLCPGRDVGVHDVLPPHCHGRGGVFGGQVWRHVQRLDGHGAGLCAQILGHPRSSWTPAGNAFSLRHVIKREYNGVFAIVFGMFFLEAARTAGLGAPAWNTEAWQAGLGGSVATFLFLRFLKKRTRVLHVEGREFSS